MMVMRNGKLKKKQQESKFHSKCCMGSVLEKADVWK